MATFSKGAFELFNHFRAVAATNKRDRITFWISRCIVFYIFKVAFLGEYSLSIHFVNVRHITRGMKARIFIGKFVMRNAGIGSMGRA